LWRADEGWFSILEVGQGANNFHCNIPACYEILYRALELDKFFGITWATENGYEIRKVNVSSLYWAGSLKTAVSELAKYNLDLVAV
jgi:hypothetical protein